jgi:phosphotransferase system  glucose/maltose/N-acetylglucosamine-specific IIC component
MIVSNLNQATASLAVSLKAKNPDNKATALSCAITAFVAGVTEPAMFGVTLKYKKPLYAAMIGNAVGGLLLGLLKVACYAFPGSGGVFAIITFTGPGNNLIFFILSAIVGMVITFILTFVMGINENE